MLTQQVFSMAQAQTSRIPLETDTLDPLPWPLGPKPGGSVDPVMTQPDLEDTSRQEEVSKPNENTANITPMRDPSMAAGNCRNLDIGEGLPAAQSPEGRKQLKNRAKSPVPAHDISCNAAGILSQPGHDLGNFQGHLSSAPSFDCNRSQSWGCSEDSHGVATSTSQGSMQSREMPGLQQDPNANLNGTDQPESHTSETAEDLRSGRGRTAKRLRHSLEAASDHDHDHEISAEDGASPAEPARACEQDIHIAKECKLLRHEVEAAGTT